MVFAPNFPIHPSKSLSKTTSARAQRAVKMTKDISSRREDRVAAGGAEQKLNFPWCVESRLLHRAATRHEFTHESRTGYTLIVRDRGIPIHLVRLRPPFESRFPHFRCQCSANSFNRYHTSSLGYFDFIELGIVRIK